MAWLGVPFTSAAAWRGFSLTEPRFWNQFITAQEQRLAPFPDFVPGSLVPVVETGTILTHAGVPGLPSADAVNLNTFRGFWASGLTPNPNLLSGIGWGIRDNIVDGAAEEDFRALDPAGGGLITPAFLERVNTILDDAGCPPMGGTVLSDPAEAATLGIPWTRKHGLRGALSTGYGRVQPGDVIGRHVFNELWAFLVALDCVVTADTFWDPGWFDSYTDDEGATASGSGVSEAAAIADMLANWTGTASPSSQGPAASVTVGGGGPFSAVGQRYRSRSSWVGLDLTHATTSATLFWSIGQAGGAFYDHDGEGKAEDRIWWVESGTVSGGGVSSSLRGSLAAPTANPGGYSSTPRIALAMSFPDP